MNKKSRLINTVMEFSDVHRDALFINIYNDTNITFSFLKDVTMLNSV